ERAEALRVTRAELIGSPRMRVDPHAPSRRTAEELVDRDAERLALDVPARLLNATESAGENRPAAIERVTIDRLPVMDDLASILPDEIGLDLGDGLRARLRASLGDRLAEADDAFVRVHAKE